MRIEAFLSPSPTSSNQSRASFTFWSHLNARETLKNSLNPTAHNTTQHNTPHNTPLNTTHHPTHHTTQHTTTHHNTQYKTTQHNTIQYNTTQNDLKPRSNIPGEARDRVGAGAVPRRHQRWLKVILCQGGQGAGQRRLRTGTARMVLQTAPPRRPTPLRLDLIVLQQNILDGHAVRVQAQDTAGRTTAKHGWDKSVFSCNVSRHNSGPRMHTTPETPQHRRPNQRQNTRKRAKNWHDFTMHPKICWLVCNQTHNRKKPATEGKMIELSLFTLIQTRSHICIQKGAR